MFAFDPLALLALHFAGCGLLASIMCSMGVLFVDTAGSVGQEQLRALRKHSLWGKGGAGGGGGRVDWSLAGACALIIGLILQSPTT